MRGKLAPHSLVWEQIQVIEFIGWKTVCTGRTHTHGCVCDGVSRDDHVTRVE